MPTTPAPSTIRSKSVSVGTVKSERGRLSMVSSPAYASVPCPIRYEPESFTAQRAACSFGGPVLPVALRIVVTLPVLEPESFRGGCSFGVGPCDPTLPTARSILLVARNRRTVQLAEKPSDSDACGPYAQKAPQHADRSWRPGPLPAKRLAICRSLRRGLRKHRQGAR